MSVWPANAIIVYSTGDPTYNTSAPGGSLTNSGWQFEGSWGPFLGTVIAPNYFITALHVGGGIGQVFTFRGVEYTTTATYAAPATDLRIWRVCGTFPEYAQIYTKTNETGESFVVFGRGTQRGGPVTTTNFLGTIKTNGWMWGPSDAVQRWGENVVSGVQTDGNVGDLIQATFDPDGGPNECDLSGGDSSGGLFIKDGAVWKLAGVNYAVDGPYSSSMNGPGFFGAIFDEGGLYKQIDTNRVFTPDTPFNQGSSFYTSRISSHADWILSVIGNVDNLVLQSSTSASGPYADETVSILDGTSKTITVPLPGGSRFYRLSACASLRITSMRVQGVNLVLNYQ